METIAVVLEQPQHLQLSRVELKDPSDSDVIVDVEWSGISTGTEKLLYSGQMPSFPGMGYPLVPGYESVGTVVHAGSDSGRSIGEKVYVPGSNGFANIRGLFGGAAARLVAAGNRVIPISADLGERGILLALAATAQHAIAVPGAESPDLIVGHGVLGRLLARLTIAAGGPAPVVWERNHARAEGATGYRVIHPDDDTRRDYRAIYDVSGDPNILDALVARLAPGGEIVLAGFYCEPLHFLFPAAFLKEARIRVAAEWKPADLLAAKSLAESGQLNLDGLITHRRPAERADLAYRTAFTDPNCLKMMLYWGSH